MVVFRIQINVLVSPPFTVDYPLLVRTDTYIYTLGRRGGPLAVSTLTCVCYDPGEVNRRREVRTGVDQIKISPTTLGP